MTHIRIEPSAASPVPAILVSWLAIFRPCFTVPVWNHILVLVAGAVLAPGKRTVTQALRVMGLADEPAACPCEGGGPLSRGAQPGSLGFTRCVAQAAASPA